MAARVAALALVLAGAVAEAADPPALAPYAPTVAGAVIERVSLSAGYSDRFVTTRVGTEFPLGVTHVIVWFRWRGAWPGHQVDVQWRLEGAILHQRGAALQQPEGSEAWVFQSTGGPLPAGNYEVTLLENGRAVTAIPFRIGGSPGTGVVMLDRYRPRVAGAAIRAVSLSASDTDEFDATRVGTEFPEGTPRVVVHYVWDGARPGLRVDARWLREAAMLAENHLVLQTVSGFGVFSVGPLPAGSYRLELSEDGRAVTEIPFRIVPRAGGGGPGSVAPGRTPAP